MGLPAGYGGESRFIAGSNAFFGVVSSSIPTVHGSTTHIVTIPLQTATTAASITMLCSVSEESSIANEIGGWRKFAMSLYGSVPNRDVLHKSRQFNNNKCTKLSNYQRLLSADMGFIIEFGANGWENGPDWLNPERGRAQVLYTEKFLLKTVSTHL